MNDLWCIPKSCPNVLLIQQISHRSKQNLAEGGMAKIEVNPTQLYDQMHHIIEHLTVILGARGQPVAHG